MASQASHAVFLALENHQARLGWGWKLLFILSALFPFTVEAWGGESLRLPRILPVGDPSPGVNSSLKDAEYDCQEWK